MYKLTAKEVDSFPKEGTTKYQLCVMVRRKLGGIAPRKKGQKKRRVVTEDEDEESKQSDENETPMRQVLRVTQYRSSSPNRDSLFSSPDNSPPRGSNKRPGKQSPM